MKNRLRTSCSPEVGRGDFKKLKTEESPVQPITVAIQPINSSYMVPLRFTQIFAPLRFAKTSYSSPLVAISASAVLMDNLG